MSRVAIVGVGAVGGFLAVRLGRTQRVHAIFRDAGKAARAQQVGLRVLDENTGHVERSHPDRVSFHVSMDEVGECDLVVVCTKRTVPGRAALAPLIGPSTRVLPLNNGIEHLVQVAGDYGNDAIVGCIRIFAEEHGGEVRHHGRGPEVAVGCLSSMATGGVAAEVAGLFEGSGVSVRVVEDARAEMWRKFVFIVATSAAGAASRVPLQRVHPPLLRRLFVEGCAVARGDGVSLDAAPMISRAQEWIQQTDREATTSLQRDVLTGRASEFDAQLGAMVRAADRWGVEAPTLRALHDALSPLAASVPVVGGAEAQARRDLAACHRLIAQRGMDDLFVTHVSLRVPGEDAFLVSPFGVLFPHVTASSLVKVRLSDGATMENDHRRQENETAVRIHAPLQRAGHVAVVHTHTAAGNAVSCTGLHPWTQKAMLAIPFVRYHDYHALAVGDDSEGAEMSAALAEGGDEAHILVLRHHGLLTVGRTMGEAFLWMEWMERACDFQTRIPAGFKNEGVSEAALERTADQARTLLGRGGPMAFDRPHYWEELLRSLTDQSWKT